MSDQCGFKAHPAFPSLKRIFVSYIIRSDDQADLAAANLFLGILSEVVRPGPGLETLDSKQYNIICGEIALTLQANLNSHTPTLTPFPETREELWRHMLLAWLETDDLEQERRFALGFGILPAMSDAEYKRSEQVIRTVLRAQSSERVLPKLCRALGDTRLSVGPLRTLARTLGFNLPTHLVPVAGKLLEPLAAATWPALDLILGPLIVVVERLARIAKVAHEVTSILPEKSSVTLREDGRIVVEWRVEGDKAGAQASLKSIKESIEEWAALKKEACRFRLVVTYEQLDNLCTSEFDTGPV